MTLYESMTRPLAGATRGAIACIGRRLRLGERGAAWEALQRAEAAGRVPPVLADRIVEAMLDGTEDGADECECILAQGRF
jgi:hypothetical protein